MGMDTYPHWHIDHLMHTITLPNALCVTSCCMCRVTQSVLNANMNDAARLDLSKEEHVHRQTADQTDIQTDKRTDKRMDIQTFRLAA